MNFACGIPALSGMRKLNMTASSDEQKLVKKLLVVFIARFLIEMRFDEREGRLRDFCKCLILCHFNSFLLYQRAYFKDNFLV